MSDERRARVFFAASSLLVSAALILQVVLTAHAHGGSFGSGPGKVFNFFCFFTVQSNIVVAITTGLLALRLDRTSTTFRTFRLVGVVAIAITGVVFHIALRDLRELTGWDAVADFILHTASPVVAVAGFLFVGPRNRVSSRIVRLAVIAPVAWLAFTLVRGPFVQDVHGRDYYPYPFLDAQQHGYRSVLLAVLVVAGLFVGVCAAAVAADRRLPGVRFPTPA
jgi:hypothetical protein